MMTKQPQLPGVMNPKRLPADLKRNLVLSGEVHAIKSILRENKLNTVCESARCPNISECFAMHTATFLILGHTCTRGCRFCSVEKGHPSLPDPEEPYRVAKTVKALAIKHVVITSVTRDDLSDGGAEHFYMVAKLVKTMNPDVTVELLTPDFNGKTQAILRVLEADFEIFNHNVETVPSLYRKIRPQADYRRSLNILNFVKHHSNKNIFTKSGLMVGLGETIDEVKSVLRDLSHVGCDIVTIGQYLMPTLKNVPVKSYIENDVYEEYKEFGRKIGIPYVFAGPFVRSSYHAHEVMEQLKRNTKTD